MTPLDNITGHGMSGVKQPKDYSIIFVDNAILHEVKDLTLSEAVTLAKKYNPNAIIVRSTEIVRCSHG